MEPYSSSLSFVTSVNEGNVSPATENGGGKVNGDAELKEQVVEVKVVKKRPDFYTPADFVVGDIVWAKCGKNFPAWPGTVIDLVWQAPETVESLCSRHSVCDVLQDYAWIKAGAIFPFNEYKDRFQVQTRLYSCKLTDFRTAINEALVAENDHEKNSAMELPKRKQNHKRRIMLTQKRQLIQIIKFSAVVVVFSAVWEKEEEILVLALGKREL